MKVVARTAVSFGDGHWYAVAQRGQARILKPDGKGYVRFTRGGHRTREDRASHRHFYELIVGPIPDGKVPDHLCRDRACCAPAHVQPVTPKENTRRGVSANRAKTHCPRGHAYAGANLYVSEGRPGVLQRSCKACKVLNQRAWRAR